MKKILLILIVLFLGGFTPGVDYQPPYKLNVKLLQLSDSTNFSYLRTDSLIRLNFDVEFFQTSDSFFSTDVYAKGKLKGTIYGGLSPKYLITLLPILE